ncbi:energy-coupling factor transporter ATPase [Companilactobacillus metriopterae]|uniref:energy-coupling factor transporter ATPase n=1 Tax=Companilactobacillus metriopterae TaxID=1909267 RepID=UPI00100AB3E8|nr:energy-coupling factor transporter ATPase [Companilactobacillus metriopterae]
MEIKLNNVSHSYESQNPDAGLGLDGVSLTIKDKSFTALIGKTGSGKSTLVKHINALLKPTSGTIKIGDREIDSKTNNKNLKPLRQKIGMVFQFPESQLFEETVEKDIMFGPMNFGATEEEARESAKDALKLVGIEESYLQQSPFDLSGGQMRRVAIAGVLASNPETIILDEPTAGLDPVGRIEIMDLFKKLNKQGKTIILVTHNMDDVADYAEYTYVMQNSKLVGQGTPKEIFNNKELVDSGIVSLPQSANFAKKLAEKKYVFDQLPITIDELSNMIKEQLENNG